MSEQPKENGSLNSSVKNTPPTPVVESPCSVEGERVHTHNFDLRLMGADLLAPSAGTDDIIRSSGFTVDPVRYTSSEGFHLGKTLPFAGCRDMITRYPA